MSRNKRIPTKKFCETCQKRVIFNENKIGNLICSRCGVVFKEEKKKPKIQDEDSFMEKFKYLI